MPSSIVVSKAAIAGGYAVGAILAGLVAAIIALASSASGIQPSIDNHERVDAQRFAATSRADSAVILELRKQTCILVADSRVEKRECLRRAFVGP